MPIEINGNTYKSKRHFFNSVFPDCEKATANEIDFYMYHNVAEYHEKKKTYYREKYRKQKNNKVRNYVKFNMLTTPNITDDEFQSIFLKELIKSLTFPGLGVTKSNVFNSNIQNRTLHEHIMFIFESSFPI